MTGETHGHGNLNTRGEKGNWGQVGNGGWGGVIPDDRYHQKKGIRGRKFPKRVTS